MIEDVRQRGTRSRCDSRRNGEPLDRRESRPPRKARVSAKPISTTGTRRGVHVDMHHGQTAQRIETASQTETMEDLSQADCLKTKLFNRSPLGPRVHETTTTT